MKEAGWGLPGRDSVACHPLTPESRTLSNCPPVSTLPCLSPPPPPPRPCPSSAVASVYREISYWPRPSPQSTVLPGPPLTLPFSSGTAQALITPIPRGGISQAPQHIWGSPQKVPWALSRSSRTLRGVDSEGCVLPCHRSMPQDGESSPYQPPQRRVLPCIPALCTVPPARPHPGTACRAIQPRLLPCLQLLSRDSDVPAVAGGAAPVVG